MSVCFGAFVAEIRIQRRVWLRSELNNMRRFYCFLAKVLRQHLQVDLTQSVVIECSNNTAYVSHLNFSHFIEQSFEHFVRARAVRPTCASPLRSTKSLTISHARALSHVFGCFFFPELSVVGCSSQIFKKNVAAHPEIGFQTYISQQNGTCLRLLRTTIQCAPIHSSSRVRACAIFRRCAHLPGHRGKGTRDIFRCIVYVVLFDKH